MSRLLKQAVYFGSLWLGVVIATFLLFHIIPSDPARTILGANASEAQVAALRERLGLDRPVGTQLVDYLAAVARFDFGRSIVDGRWVSTEVWDRLQVTLAIIVLAAMAIVAYAAFAVGAARRRSHVVPVLDSLCLSLPTMFVAVLVAIGIVSIGLVPPFRGRLESASDWLALAPAAVVLAMYPMAILSRVLRRAIRQLEAADFVRTARSKGLSEGRVFFIHLLGNALIPGFAVLSNQVPFLFTSCFVVEVIFSLPGTGALLISSLLQRDLPMLEGLVIWNSLVVILCLIVIEGLYSMVDPRVGDAA